MSMVDYTTPEAVLRRMPGDGQDEVTAADVAAIVDELISAFSEYIDIAIGVPNGFFGQAGDALTSKTLRGNGTTILKLPPYVKDGGFAVSLQGSALVEDTDYYINDDGALVRDPAPAGTSWGLMDYDTYYASRYPLETYSYSNGSPGNPLSPYNATPVGWPRRVPVLVTARWGFSEIPSDIQEAVTQSVHRLFQTTVGNVTGMVGDLKANGLIIETSMTKFAREVIERWRQKLREVRV